MAVRRQIRRHIKRAGTTVRRSPSSSAIAARMDAKRSTPSDIGLMIGGVHDPAEKAADQMADRVMGMSTAGSVVHRKCIPCEDEDQKVQRMPEESTEEETVQAKSVSNSTPVVAGDSAVSASPGVSNTIRSMGAGRPLARSDRAFFEPRFGADLSSVRIHDNPAADKASREIHARAFTLGKNIAFAKGERQPGTKTGRYLMAHELAHVVGNRQTEQRKVRRDLAVGPPNPGARPGNLTEQEYAAAQRFNERRFEDPFTVSIVRDVLGINKTPAVIDQSFTEATMRWQAMFGLQEDGKFGPSSTRRLVRVLQAEGNHRLARLVRSDNFVRVHDVVERTFFGCVGAPGHAGRAFQWDVNFSTSLRNGFIVQRIDNVWNQNPAPAAGQSIPRPRYWEAWSVDGRGNVTPKNGNVNDMWRRPMRPNTRGNWRMTARLYTVLNLPATFGAGNVPDAGVLRSSLANPGADLLGLPEGFAAIQLGDEGTRRIGGRWDCADPVPGNRFHRQE